MSTLRPRTAMTFQDGVVHHDPAAEASSAIGCMTLGEGSSNAVKSTKASSSLANAVPTKPRLSSSDNYGRFVRLAASLNNVGVMLQESGKADEALKTFQEAVQVRMDALKLKKDPNAKVSTSQDKKALAARCSSAERAEMGLQVRRSQLPPQVEPPLDLYPLHEDDEGEWWFDDDDYTVASHNVSKPFQIAQREDSPNQENDEKKQKEEDDRDSAVTLYNMGLLYCVADNDDHAEKMFEMARTILSHTSCPALAAMLLNNIALIRLRDDDPQAAVDCLSEALQVFSEATSLTTEERRQKYCQGLAPSNEFDVEKCVAFTLSLMGRIYYVENQPRQAFDFLKECLKLRRSALGDDHIDVAVTLYNIGLTLRRLGDLKGALTHCECFLEHSAQLMESMPSASPSSQEKQFRRSSSVSTSPQESIQGDRQHRRVAQVASAWQTAGNMHLEDQSVRKATESLNKSLVIRRNLMAVLGDDDEQDESAATAVASSPASVMAILDAGRTLVDLGKIMQNQGRHREALSQFREALELYRAQGHEGEIAAIHCLVGQVHQDQGNHERSIESYEIALSTLRSTYGDVNRNVVDLLMILGNAFLEMGETEDAMANFADAERIAEQLENDPSNDGFRNGGSLISTVAVAVNPMQYLGRNFQPAAAAA